MKRYESLDWLRGLMAFAIMIYHLVSWQLLHPESGTLLGNFGIYGVSIFFVLSGLSMAIVYHSFIKDFSSSGVFFIRRIFRLWPLLWVCIFAVSAINFISSGQIDLLKILLNLTTLFGFVAPDQYINVGAWSIGNEVVYYALTPFLIALYNYNRLLGNLAVLATVAVGFYFGFVVLQPTTLLATQWSTYINPFNNLFLYTCGIALYYNFHEIDFKKLSWVLVIIPLLVFGFYPVSGDQINIVTGVNRVVFAGSAIALTLGFYKLILDMPAIITGSLANLGEATYGVYLLHPIVYLVISKVVAVPIIVILASAILTIIAANISYRYFEKPWIRMGKKVSTIETKTVPTVQS